MLMIVSVVVAQESDVAEKLKGGPRGLCDGSTVQGGGGSFKKRKTIGEIGWDVKAKILTN